LPGERAPWPHIDSINILINIDSTMQETVSAQQAAVLLGVKPQTIYAYASRGLVRRVGRGKRRRYLVEDLERLRARQRARSGHGPVAASALSFGEPVLDTCITSIDEQGPRYRGHTARALLEAGASFEQVATLLWTGELRARAPVWEPLAPGSALRPASTIEELMLALPTLGKALMGERPRTLDAELRLAGSLVRSLAEQLVSPRKRRAKVSVAALLATRAESAGTATQAALDTALVLLADHELNASSFAARVAASTGASLLACLTAGLATLSGPRHGGACDRVEALLDEAATLKRPTDVVARRTQRGELVPGFGHPLYAHGDPRAKVLLQLSEKLCQLSAKQRPLAIASSLSRYMTRQGLPPTVDFGLVTLTRALGMNAGSAALLFAVGRAAGWVAHVLEQRQSEVVLRPRARYVGP
jgi:citrate synthase